MGDVLGIITCHASSLLSSRVWWDIVNKLVFQVNSHLADYLESIADYSDNESVVKWP